MRDDGLHPLLDLVQLCPISPHDSRAGVGRCGPVFDAAGPNNHGRQPLLQHVGLPQVRSHGSLRTHPLGQPAGGLPTAAPTLAPSSSNRFRAFTQVSFFSGTAHPPFPSQVFCPGYSPHPPCPLQSFCPWHTCALARAQPPWPKHAFPPPLAFPWQVFNPQQMWAFVSSRRLGCRPSGASASSARSASWAAGVSSKSPPGTKFPPPAVGCPSDLVARPRTQAPTTSPPTAAAAHRASCRRLIPVSTSDAGGVDACTCPRRANSLWARASSEASPGPNSRTMRLMSKCVNGGEVISRAGSVRTAPASPVWAVMRATVMFTTRTRAAARDASPASKNSPPTSWPVPDTTALTVGSGMPSSAKNGAVAATFVGLPKLAPAGCHPQ